MLKIKTLVALLSAISADERICSFNEFVRRYESISKADIQHRKHTFEQNLAVISSHNSRYEQGLESFDLAVNRFADLSNEEFMQLQGLNSSANFTLPIFEYPGNTPVYTKLPDKTTPKSLNWVDLGKVSSVKNQLQLYFRSFSIFHLIFGYCLEIIL